MRRGAIRMTMGLLLVLAVGLMLTPVLWPASAAGRVGSAFQPGRTIPTITLPIPTTTTPLVTIGTVPPTTSSAVTTPTTARSATTRPRPVTTTATTAPSTTTTSTTLAPISGPAPAPVTLPLATASQSGNISAFFPIMSGFGFLLLIGLLTAQWILTKPGSKGPTL